jgi:hypothetical protein
MGIELETNAAATFCEHVACCDDEVCAGFLTGRSPAVTLAVPWFDVPYAAGIICELDTGRCTPLPVAVATGTCPLRVLFLATTVPSVLARALTNVGAAHQQRHPGGVSASRPLPL